MTNGVVWAAGGPHPGRSPARGVTRAPQAAFLSPASPQGERGEFFLFPSPLAGEGLGVRGLINPLAAVRLNSPARA
jgi:hypothetical protein